MSGFRGPLKGLLVNGVWHCDCNPRTPAVHFQVKKEGPNKGKWFRSCQKQIHDGDRCKFFLWDNDAYKREAAALSDSSRTEPGRADPDTPSRRQLSPPPPYPIETAPSNPSRKRNRVAIDSEDEDEDGSEQSDHSVDRLDHVMTAVETPSKAVKTSHFATPATRRKLPWPMETTATTSAHGLYTPQTARRTSNDPFATRLATPGSGAFFTPSMMKEQDGQTYQTGTPSSSLETPTPNRFKNVAADELVQDVFHLLQDGSVRLPPDTETELTALLSKHAMSAAGYKRGREVSRKTIDARNARITELTYRVSTLEAELEAQKAMVEFLQDGGDLQSDT